MNLSVSIQAVNRTSRIHWPSFSISDRLNSQNNTCNFTVKVYASGWKPVVGNTITVLDGATKIFAGSIVRITKKPKGAFSVDYEVECADYTFDLRRINVVESYTGMQADEIIDDLLANYMPGFTATNVTSTKEIASIKFDHISVADALEKLAQMIGYSWYVDYDKDIHFFALNEEPAPFGLSDNSGNYIFNSLVLTDDISQVRNLVRVRGGTIVGDSRTEKLSGDNVNKFFKLANKFSSLPVVKVGGVDKTVGEDYLSVEADYDCFWNFNEKYLKFKDSTLPPSGTNNIEVIGTPLIPIIVQVQDDNSIVQFGECHFYKKDTTIKSKEEAKEFALAEITSYGSQVVEGEFQTDVSGLMSGQTINIQSAIRDIAGSDYLIQSVQLKMRGNNLGTWKVTLATLRTMGIIKVLQEHLLKRIGDTQEAEDEVLEKFYTDFADINVQEEISKIEVDTVDEQTVQVTEQIRKDPFVPEFVLADYFPVDDSDPKRPMRLDISSYLY